MSTSDLSSKIRYTGQLILGALILVVHVAIFSINQQLFTILICMYVTAYSILVITVFYKNRSSIDTMEMNLLVNLSFYTVFLEVFIIILTIAYMIYKKN